MASPGPNPPAPPPPAANASIKWHNPLDPSLLPIPIVAAAGIFLALGHDHVLMRRDRGFLYMSEVDLAITLPDYFSALVRSKIGCRDIMVDAQCGEVLYIPGVMTPTEVRASFKT